MLTPINLHGPFRVTLNVAVGSNILRGLVLYLDIYLVGYKEGSWK